MLDLVNCFRCPVQNGLRLNRCDADADMIMLMMMVKMMMIDSTERRKFLNFNKKILCTLVQKYNMLT